MRSFTKSAASQYQRGPVRPSDDERGGDLSFAYYMLTLGFWAGEKGSQRVPWFLGWILPGFDSSTKSSWRRMEDPPRQLAGTESELVPDKRGECATLSSRWLTPSWCDRHNRCKGKLAETVARRTVPGKPPQCVHRCNTQQNYILYI